MNPAPGEALGLQHAAAIESALAARRAQCGHEALSEYCFSNLYFFRAVHRYRYLPGPWPAVAGVTYDGRSHLLPLFDLSRAPADLVRDQLAAHDCYFPLPAAQVAALDPAVFACTALDADADYLYPADNFRHYRGALLRKKFNLMKQLLASARVEAFPYATEHAAAAQTILETWMQDKGKAANEADVSACREALALAERFTLDGRIYYADGRPAGFALTQALAPTTRAVRFAKGIDACKGIYPYMFNELATADTEVEWFNFEQDLGLANFRQTKRSFAPSALLAKYRVQLREARAKRAR